LLVEPWQMQIERTLTPPKDIVALAADYLSHQLPTVAGLAHDLLDRYSVFRQRQDRRVRLVSAEIALILDTLRRRQQLRIDLCCADDATDLAHGFPNGIEEGMAGVLHQMPAIRDLYSVRQGLSRRFAIPSATIAGDNLDRRMIGEPA